MGDYWQWLVGYQPPSGWSQTAGGDVYSNLEIVSRVITTNPDQTMFSVANPDPGLVLYGGSGSDFSITDSDNGIPDRISASKWNENLTLNSYSDFYNTFLQRVGPTSTCNDLGADRVIESGDVTGAGNPQLCTYGTGSETYTISGGSTWNVADKHIVFVNGDLIIEQQITISPGGFISFIVSGDITVDKSLGSSVHISAESALSTAGHLGGIYITDGVFEVQDGSQDPTPQFTQLIGKGIFVAGSFTLNRSLGSDNALYPPTVFIHNPRLLIDMPDEMKDTPLLWEEVAPRSL